MVELSRLAIGGDNEGGELCLPTCRISSFSLWRVAVVPFTLLFVFLESLLFCLEVVCELFSISTLEVWDSPERILPNMSLMIS